MYFQPPHVLRPVCRLLSGGFLGRGCLDAAYTLHTRCLRCCLEHLPAYTLHTRCLCCCLERLPAYPLHTRCIHAAHTLLTLLPRAPSCFGKKRRFPVYSSLRSCALAAVCAKDVLGQRLAVVSIWSLWTASKLSLLLKWTRGLIECWGGRKYSGEKN